MEELCTPGDGTTCRLVAPGDTEELHRELDRLAPGLEERVEVLLTLNRPEMRQGPAGTALLLFTVDVALHPVRWLVVSTDHGVLVVGDPDHATGIREALTALRPGDGPEALRVVLMGLAKSIAEVLDASNERSGVEDADLEWSRKNRRKRLRQARAKLFKLQELFTAESHLLEELPEAHSHERVVRRARSAFDQGASTCARLYALAGDQLSEESAIVNERLTLVSTVFLPATVTTGFFGMNFNWMVNRIDSMTAFLALGVLVPLVVSAATFLLVTRLGAGRE